MNPWGIRVYMRRFPNFLTRSICQSLNKSGEAIKDSSPSDLERYSIKRPRYSSWHRRSGQVEPSEKAQSYSDSDPEIQGKFVWQARREVEGELSRLLKPLAFEDTAYLAL